LFKNKKKKEVRERERDIEELGNEKNEKRGVAAKLEYMDDFSQSAFQICHFFPFFRFISSFYFVSLLISEASACVILNVHVDCEVVYIVGLF